MIKAQILEQLNDLCDTQALDLTAGCSRLYQRTVHSRPHTFCISKRSGEAAVVTFNVTRQDFDTVLTYAVFAIVSCRAVVVAFL